ncbi:MAG: DNA modification methylase, partial [Dysgonomonas sp.]
NIVNEYEILNGTKPKICLEPFSGSGTTPLELQKEKIKCYAFEVSPFMYNLSCTKLVTDYTISTFCKYRNILEKELACSQNEYSEADLYPGFRTLVENSGTQKWNFDKEVMYGILDIKSSIQHIFSHKYKNLFSIALASILLDVSNVYRNGKCISYKKDWQNISKCSREEVHRIFLQKLDSVFVEDIKKLEKYRKNDTLFSNRAYLFNGDSRLLIQEQIQDNSIDLVITSPPYLNSRDYTDTYMVELKVLDYMKDLNDISKLRKKTIRSHVQLKWGSVEDIESETLSQTINQISEFTDEFWNKELLNMIKGYFVDMNTIFCSLYDKMTDCGMIYFNVANSAYYGVEVEVDKIVCEIAENNGFNIKEIREARRINPSSQQRDTIDDLRESVIVIQKQLRM